MESTFQGIEIADFFVVSETTEATTDTLSYRIESTWNGAQRFRFRVTLRDAYSEDAARFIGHRAVNRSSQPFDFIPPQLAGEPREFMLSTARPRMDSVSINVRSADLPYILRQGTLVQIVGQYKTYLVREDVELSTGFTAIPIFPRAVSYTHLTLPTKA